MAAVAAQGYQELTQAMVGAAAQQSDPLDRLKRAGLGYVTFALRRPEHFTVMFDAPISERKHPDSAEAAKQAFGLYWSSSSAVRTQDDYGREIRIKWRCSLRPWFTASLSWPLLAVSPFAPTPRFSSLPNS
jgi:hypothetical protein